MRNAEKIQRMYELFEAVRERTITDPQFHELDLMMAADKWVCQCYFEYFNMCAILKSRKAFCPQPAGGDPACNFELWQAMAEHAALTLPPGPVLDMETWNQLSAHENMAEAIAVPETEVFVNKPRSPISVLHPKRQVSKLALAAAFCSLAAMVIILVYVQRSPVRESVAVLRGAAEAAWMDAAAGLDPGGILYSTDASRTLLSGVVELEFESGAQVILEGPCEFACQSDDLISLQSGKLYAIVPHTAAGFSVVTPNARVVDLGTEFGVISRTDGTTEAHVFKGLIELFAGRDGEQSSVQVQEGVAGRVDAANRISEIELQGRLFVRAISSPAPSALSKPETGTQQGVTFFAVANCHYKADKADNAPQAAVIQQINSLPGIPYPAEFGPGTVDMPRGIIVVGDLIEGFQDSAVKRQQWENWQSDFGVNGEGLIRFPVYEGFGNRDVGNGFLVQDEIRERNRRRSGIHTDPTGLHYSWDWNNIHFVHLNLYPGNTWLSDSKYGPEHDPNGALAFLVSDLAAHVGTSGRPVVLFHHYDVGTRDDFWTSPEQAAYYQAIEPYHIICIVSSNTYTDLYEWNGISAISIGQLEKAIFVFHIEDDQLAVLQRRTDGTWDRTLRKSIVRNRNY